MSKIARFGLHSYRGIILMLTHFLKSQFILRSSFWMTEWNAWRNGLDDGQIGIYDYKFASECVNYLLDLLKNGATAAIEWEGYDSYYEHHEPSTFSNWGILEYNHDTKLYSPRKHLYAISQVSKFVLPGSWQISVSESGDSLNILAFQYYLKSVIIVGINTQNNPVTIKGSLVNLPEIDRFEMYHTSSSDNLHKDNDVTVTSKAFKTTIPANCIFTLTGKEVESKTASTKHTKPEPSDWYAGDIHLHRNCGDDTQVLPDDKFTEMMEPNDLAVISVLVGTGNAEVTDPKADFAKVNGQDAPQSEPGRIVHWDAEWHWDATGVQFEHQALGGHIVLLGLKEAYQIWDESPYKILEWAKKQNAICGYAHMQYLNDQIPNKLDCCIPIDYPVEAALGTIDFLSEDVNG